MSKDEAATNPIQTFFDYCKQEILKGDDFKARIKYSSLYRKLAMEYDNIDDVIERAEKSITIDVRMEAIIENSWRRLLEDRRMLVQIQDTDYMPPLESFERESLRVFTSICTLQSSWKGEYDAKYGDGATRARAEKRVKEMYETLMAERDRRYLEQEVRDNIAALIDFRLKLEEWDEFTKSEVIAFSYEVEHKKEYDNFVFTFSKEYLIKTINEIFEDILNKIFEEALNDDKRRV
jgi:hypothetical protein